MSCPLRSNHTIGWARTRAHLLTVGAYLRWDAVALEELKTGFRHALGEPRLAVSVEEAAVPVVRNSPSILHLTHHVVYGGEVHRPLLRLDVRLQSRTDVRRSSSERGEVVRVVRVVRGVRA